MSVQINNVSMNINAIISFLDDFLTKTGRISIDPVEANALLAKAGLLRDSKDRPGKPLRDILRKGVILHAFQSGGKGSSWIIPLSTSAVKSERVYSINLHSNRKTNSNGSETTSEVSKDLAQLKLRLESARSRYMHGKIKYVLVAEAPPDSLDRFFYYENVRQHDYLYLGIAQALYPDLKNKFLTSGRKSEIKKTILEKFQRDGFYFLDLSELPLSLMNRSLESQVPSFLEKLKPFVYEETRIILIKANVYDILFPEFLNRGFNNVIDVRIPFPGQGGQKRFQMEFGRAMELTGYTK